MVELIFSLRFQSQLRRTRPKLLSGLEKSILDAIESYGGIIKVEQKLIIASFNRETIGFWLDIVCLLETIRKSLEKASSELFGHICVVGEDLNGLDIPLLVRSLPSNLWGTGIWCAPGIIENLKPYIDFDKALDGTPAEPEGKNINDEELPSGEELTIGYSQVRTLRELGDPAEIQTREKNNSEKIRAYLKQGASRNSIIVGEEKIGKLEGLYRYCEEQMKGFPPLLVRFKQGHCSVISFTDALSPEIKKLFAGEELKKLENLYYSLFQERLREELSEFTVNRGKRFFSLLLETYKTAAENQSVKPMMILDKIQDADADAKIIIKETCFSCPAKDRIKIFGTATKIKALETWEELFPRIIKFTPEKAKAQAHPVLPLDLWEMGYCCELLKRYFPSFLLPQLLQEEGKNPAMVERAMALLSRLQMYERIDFSSKADEILGKNAQPVRDLVRRRLLVWVKDFRLKPCFALLSALADLGSGLDENLILDSIKGDLINGTYRNIDKAIEDGAFASVAGNDKSLLSIINTQKALSNGSREDIIRAFKDASPGASRSPGIRAGMFSNAASYYLSIFDISLAAESIKEAMLISQNENSGRELGRIYRLFSLVAFTSQKLGDSLDYFSFAVEHAEKAGDLCELGIAYYYAAVANFIFGNISKAKYLVVKAQKASLEALLPGWADRSRFLEGRLYFETGLYRQALDIFTDLRDNYHGSTQEDFEQTVDAWIFRSNVYLNKKYENSEELKGLDAELFITEASFINGDYRKTLLLAKDMEQSRPDDHFEFIERPDWRSGFHQCELLLFSHEDLWKRMIHTFKALALYHINSEDHPEIIRERDEAIREMQHKP